MAMIVSANYLDRKGEFPWLVRDAEEDPKKAVAVKSVRAIGVRFQHSGTYESGFGCGVVAYCDKVLADDESLSGAIQNAKTAPIQFDGIKTFYRQARFLFMNLSIPVYRCRALLLGADRKILAVV